MQISPNLYAYPWSSMAANNCNTYLSTAGKVMMVDPGHAQLYGNVENGLAKDGIKDVPELVILTHCHPDHMEAASMLQKIGAKVAMGEKEAEFLEGEGKSLAAALGMSAPEITFDLFLKQGELDLGGEKFQVIDTPGHTPGHICLYQPSLKTLYTGDLVFAQGVGRVDFPGGSGEQLKRSILEVSKLDVELVLPGHGPIIKGTEQVKANFEMIVNSYFGML
jgi:hydroxyacylglutathione hydrolase